MNSGNRITQLFQNKQKAVLSIYTTAGYPQFNSTIPIIKAIQSAGADMIEIGMPFSDPVADGPTIQLANQQALANGMTLQNMFAQLMELRAVVTVPVLLMGYLNPILQFGVEKFCKTAEQVGIDGIILPDLPPEIYPQEFKNIFQQYNLKNILLITPNTSTERIVWIDSISDSFIYAVSSSAVTGGQLKLDDSRLEYLRKLKDLNLQNPIVVGFGISDSTGYKQISNYADGAIIGSAFIRAPSQNHDPEQSAYQSVKGVLS